MSRSVSNTFKQAVFAQQTGEAFVMLVTLSNDNLTDDIRVCSDPFELLPIAGQRGIVSQGLEYIYLPFSIMLPSEDDTGTARARISIDNISREIIQAVRSTSGKVGFNISIILASAPDVVEMTMTDFVLDSVSYDALVIEGDISVEYFDLEPYPSKRFTPSDFPGVF